MQKDKLIIYCDGGARGNPGPAAAAFVVYQDQKKVFSGSQYLGRTTNNLAEYGAVWLAFEWLLKNRDRFKQAEIIFFLDSELITKQLKGEFRIKKSHLQAACLQIKAIEANFLSVKYQHIERQKNKIADRLVNLTLDNLADES